MATFLHHEPCPKCGSRDNLGVYSDGSCYCFGCHYISSGWRNSSFLWETSISGNRNVSEEIVLPDDLCNSFPLHVVEWFQKYFLTVEEALKYGWKYSPRYDQLVFLFKDNEGRVACTQARNFSKEAKRKYYNQGSVSDVLPLFRSTCPSKRVVVVEDAVSAARIARQSDCLACLGSSLPVKKINALKGLKYEQVVVWLDSDKLKEAWNIETNAKWLGLSARTTHTPLDPKCYTDGGIKKLLDKFS